MPRLVPRLTVAFALIAAACQPMPITAQSAGEPQTVEFRTTDGARMTLDALRGKVVLLDFWATWCAPCLVELPRLRRLHDELGSTSLVIVGISLDTIEPRRLASWTRRNDIGWPLVHDGRGYNGALARQFGVEELPATVLFDRDGRLAARDLRGERLEAAIRALLAGVGRD